MEEHPDHQHPDYQPTPKELLKCGQCDYVSSYILCLINGWDSVSTSFVQFREAYKNLFFYCSLKSQDPSPPLTKIKLMDFTSNLFFRRPVINSPSTDTLKSVMRRRVVVWIVQVVGQTLQGKNI